MADFVVGSPKPGVPTAERRVGSCIRRVGASKSDCCFRMRLYSLFQFLTLELAVVVEIVLPPVIT